MRVVLLDLMLVLFIVSMLLVLTFDKNAWQIVWKYFVLIIFLNVMLLVTNGTVFFSILSAGLICMNLVAVAIYGVFADDIFKNEISPTAVRVFFVTIIVMGHVVVILN